MLTDLEQRALEFLQCGPEHLERIQIRQQLIRDLEAKRDAGANSKDELVINERR
jgi:hypothetical protein